MALKSIDILNEQKQSFIDRIDAVTQTIYDLAGQTFNISSPKQLGEILI
jgi:DNA polymerase I-like protein with 3'-5' exonuclease and polymerase domains